MGILLDVYNKGGDAVKNMFEVYFYGLPPSVARDTTTSGGWGIQDANDNPDSPSLRTTTISIPQAGIVTYEVPFKTATIKMPGGKLEWEMQFTTEFRIDRYWELYRDLVTWRNKLCSPDGTIGEDVWFPSTDTVNSPRNTRCESVVVKSFILGDTTANAQAQHAWQFLRCYPSKINNVEFTYAEGTNVTISVDFSFIEMRDLHHNFGTEDLDDLNTAATEEKYTFATAAANQIQL